MSYDANGNMSASGFNGPETYNFDVENRLVHNRQLDGFGLQDDYVYDGAGNLVRRRATSWSYPGAVDQKNLYVDGLYEEYSNFCDAPGVTTKFYMAFGRIIARRDSNGGLAYLLADHLGSNVGSIKATTGATTTNKYYPFGAPRLNTSPYGDKAYTGQQKEIVSYLDAYYYHARFYSPDLGHFLSADSMASTADSRGLNRYAYAGNNPVRYNDPSGHCFLDQPCGWTEAQMWVQCALTCDHNPLGDVARVALTQNSFWSNFGGAYASGGRDNVALFELIAGGAHEDTLHVLFQNTLGGNYLSSIFGAGYRAAYFEASLGDVLFGTARVSELSIGDIEGVTDWSAGLGWIVGLRTLSGQNAVAKEALYRLGRVQPNLANRTLETARGEAAAGHDVAGLQWSNLQRGWLRGNGFPDVNVSEGTESIYQTAAEDILGCATDPTCLAGAFWRAESEVEYYYP